MRDEKIRKITGTGILLGLVIVFQLIGNFVQLGPVSITLALIPVAVGAIMYGPLVGAFLGLVDGAMCLFAPATLTIFMNTSVVGTFVTCLTKTTVAGLLAGLIYLPFKNKNQFLGVILASISLPLINTGMFVGYCFAFFMPKLEELAGGKNVVEYLFLVFIGWNFILEFVLNAGLSPVIYRVFKKYLCVEK